MYSYEIEQLLKKRNYLVSIKEYIEILNSSQINYMELNTQNGEVTISTSDNYIFKLKIRKEL